jgi:tetratricopeptide (TPR) repeat protein
VEQGKLRAAVIEYKNVLQQEPEHAEARLRLGETYVLLGDGPSARKEVERAMEYGIKGVEVETALVRAMLLQREFTAALARLRSHSFGWDPSDVSLSRGIAYLGLGKAELAEEAFRESLQADARKVEAIRGLAGVALSRQDVDEARRQLERAIAVSEKDVNTWLVLGSIESYYGNHDKAEMAYRGALDVDGGSLVARLGLAEALIRKGDLDSADKEIEKAAADLPDGHPVPNYLRALAASQKGNVVQARSLLGEVLARQPEHLEALFMMATIHYRSDELAQAELLAKRFVSLAPENLTGRRLLAAVYLRMRQPDRVIDVLENIETVPPGQESVYIILGSAYMQKRSFAEAAQAFEKAAALKPEDGAVRTKLAQGYLASGDPNRAVSVLESVVDMDREFSPARYMLAATHMQRQDYAEVLAVAQELSRKQPDSPLPYVYMGEAYVAMNEPEKARDAFEKALQLDPGLELASARLAKMEQQSGQTDSARQRYEAILASDSVDPQALRAAAKALAEMDLAKGDVESAKARYRAVLAKVPEDSYALTSLAQLAAGEGRMSEAIKLLVRARTSDPSALGPVLVLSAYYTRAGDTKNALETAEDAYALAPEDNRVLLLLATAQTGAGDLNAALATQQKLAAADPDSVTAQLQLAQSAMRANDRPVARRALEKVLTLDPDHNQAKLMLGQVALQSGQPGVALELARDLKARLPESGVVYLLEADALMAQGDSAAAAEAYFAGLERIDNGELAVRVYEMLSAAGQAERGGRALEAWLARNPDDATVLTATGTLLVQAGRTDDAISRYEKALRQEPDNALALNNLAWLYQSKGDERALDIAKRAYDLNPRDPDVLDTYGWILIETDQNERGIGVLRQALKLSPESPTARYHLAVGLTKVGEMVAALKELDALLSSGREFDERGQAMVLRDQLRAQ